MDDMKEKQAEMEGKTKTQYNYRRPLGYSLQLYSREDEYRVSATRRRPRFSIYIPPPYILHRLYGTQGTCPLRTRRQTKKGTFGKGAAVYAGGVKYVQIWILVHILA